MRIFILILATLTAFTASSQMTINWAGSSRTFLPGTSETISVNFLGSARILVVCNRHNTSPNRPTVTSPTAIWEDLGSMTMTIGTQVMRMTAFVTYQSGGTQTATINFGGQTPSFYSRQMWYGTGRNIRVRQVVSDAQSSANPSITMSALAGNNNAVVMSVTATPFTAAWGTAEAGWTENEDYGTAQSFGQYNMSRANHSDNTPSVTGASTTWMGFAIELKANRRIYIN